MKIKTEIQRNVKLSHLLDEKVICLTLTEKKNTISRQNWTGLHWPALACTYVYGQRFKMEPHFSNFSLNLDFQDSENETPNKRIIKMTDEELEKITDAPFFSRFTRYMTRTPD